ncbi:piwi-like protein Ago3 isoform X2 [Macrosteles quadrilineatus]|uniref:piwi-like protein Ago3 isoform X2 n=1 Tax=Macrosteles quadrilineatus TaxID=74068 RepID=UPI0023E2C557|nr:piwi-like protein Ago3 isoform X2 [Macrosteles quadrilineatus]
MAEKKQIIAGRGGRGAIIAKLLEMQRPPGHPPQDGSGDAPPPHVQTPPPRVSGRGAQLQKLLQSQPPPAPTPAAISAPVPTAGPAPRQGGRGQILQALASQSARASPATPTPSTAAAPSPAVQPQPVAEVADITRQMKRVDIDTPPVIMRGKDGREVNATANYIPLYLKPGRGIYEYEVRFSPAVDDRGQLEQMLFVQHKDILSGKRRTFDGVTMYLPHKLEVESVTSIHPVTKEEHKITFIYRRERSMRECLHFYNVLFNNIQRELKLQRIGREYFSPDGVQAIPQHQLEIWPGYVTAVDAFEGGVMLNCNTSHKVLRTQTVLKLMDDIIHQTGGNQWKEVVQKQLIGQSVMTRKPIKIYRIDDIDFSLNPTSTFTCADGTEMTYIGYHERKGIQIRDHNQPLLVHRPKPTKRPGGIGLLMLIPELCFMTGLSDEMRADFKVMKDVATITRVNPNQRVLNLQKLINNIKSNPRCVEMLEEWGLQVPERPLEMTARILNPEQITFGRGFTTNGNPQADWNRDATSQHMLEVVNIDNWIVMFASRDERNAHGYVEMMGKVCPLMGVQIEYPSLNKLRDDKPDTYVKNLKESVTEKTQLVVVIFPTQREDRYSAIKKFCCLDRPVPSQVINSRTISKPDKLRSIVQKIALQINCKLGGSLWSVRIPFANAMICGMDSYHDTKSKNRSVAGFVASMNKEVTKWFSQVFIQSNNQELLNGIHEAMCQAILNYYERNNRHPDTIIVFRDGVGDGQLRVCEELEIGSLKKAFSSISPDYNPSLCFIVCQKRINTRIFLPKGRDFENPPPGSVVDNTITRRTLFDFFLVSQLVRQGTVTPTHYVVLHNSTHLDPDKIQKLTYKMCHLYYNWPGTIRVPAPCQYSHKLAYLVGTSLHKEPSRVLSDRLFFL